MRHLVLPLAIVTLFFACSSQNEDGKVSSSERYGTCTMELDSGSFQVSVYINDTSIALVRDGFDPCLLTVDSISNQQLFVFDVCGFYVKMLNQSSLDVITLKRYYIWDTIITYDKLTYAEEIKLVKREHEAVDTIGCRIDLLPVDSK